MHSHGKCSAVQKILLTFKTSQGLFWEERVPRKFRLGGFPNPRKVEVGGRGIFGEKVPSKSKNSLKFQSG